MNKILEIVEKNVDMENLVSQLLAEVAEPELQKYVEKTKTPIDDMAKAAIYDSVAKTLVKLAKDLWSELDGK